VAVGRARAREPHEHAQFAVVNAPLAIDLFCGLGGWTEGLLSEGYYVVGFDVERHHYGSEKYPAQLVLQDVLTIHGKQFKDAALIVASPPCQEFSYMAMPWSKAKAIRAEYLSGKRAVKKLTALFDACFRIQREAIEAAGRFIPLVVENVRGACEWVGRSRWNYGSFHLWGDVPALMPMTKAVKVPGMNWSGLDKPGYVAVAFNDARHTKNNGGSWFNIGSPGQKVTNQNPVSGAKNMNIHMPYAELKDHVKQGGDWFNSEQPSISRLTGSKSAARKAASARIAKIPFPLAQHIARYWKPQ